MHDKEVNEHEFTAGLSVMKFSVVALVGILKEPLSQPICQTENSSDVVISETHSDSNKFI